MSGPAWVCSNSGFSVVGLVSTYVMSNAHLLKILKLLGPCTKKYRRGKERGGGAVDRENSPLLLPPHFNCLLNWDSQFVCLYSRS